MIRFNKQFHPYQNFPTSLIANQLIVMNAILIIHFISRKQFHFFLDIFYVIQFYLKCLVTFQSIKINQN